MELSEVVVVLDPRFFGVYGTNFFRIRDPLVCTVVVVGLPDVSDALVDMLMVL